MTLHRGIQRFIESDQVNALHKIIEVAVGGDLKKRQRLARVGCKDFWEIGRASCRERVLASV